MNGITVPPNTVLYAGPDTDQPVGRLQDNYAVIAAEPVVWKEASGDTWFAFFLSCGGKNLYWVSLDEVRRVDPNAAKTIEGQLALGGELGLQAIGIAGKNFKWNGSHLNFTIARGEEFGPVA